MASDKIEAEITNLVKACTEGFKKHPHFESWQYQRIWQENFQDKVIGELEKFIPDLKGRRIVEVGSGMGGLLVAMEKKGYDITGVEPQESYRTISLLRAKRYDLMVDIKDGRGESLPFPDASFDFIVAKDVIEHCENPKILLQECFRVLEGGGKMYITVPNRFGFEDPHYFLRFVNWLPREFGEIYVKFRGRQKEQPFDRQRLTDMHYFTIGQFTHLARSFGFRIINLDEVKFRNINFVNSIFRKRVLRLSRALSCDIFLYKAAQIFYFPVFQFILIKER